MMINAIKSNRELASVRPTTVEALRYIRGIGEKRRIEFGVRLIECIRTHQ